MSPEELAELVAKLRVIGTDQQNVEVKSGVGKSIKETLSAFSNADGGTIIVGLSEETNFSPVQNFNHSQASDKLETFCQQITPVIVPDIKLIPFEGTVLLVAIVKSLPATDKPAFITDKGRYRGSYIRLGDGDVMLSEYEVSKMLEEKTPPTWDQQPVAAATLEDLDEQLLNSFLELHRGRRPKTFADGEDAALKRLKITGGNHPTMASLLTMGIYPQEFFPRLTLNFAAFPGTEKGTITTGVRLLDSATITGTIPELISAGVDKVANNMRTAGFIDNKFRTNIPDYPLIAVREALVNALMHRDYAPAALGSPVHINMFVDRLEISNPGGLYGGVTVNNLGKPGVSSTRNQLLATFLEDIPLEGGGTVAENRGTGIPTINKALADALMPTPEIINRLDSFTIVFHKRRVAPTESYGTAFQQVLAILNTKASASSAELSAETGLSRTAIQRALNQALAQGLIEQTEPARSPKQRYRVLPRDH
ncbi:DNA-binding protein [Corynebacterium phocae]|uniref:DNA-binding protein n=1 Tax=Corynebacterium phocae TaxID=161895 RepID=A0A1L7D137_9CORY|nr:ATP-binding protein [Corynebacterium phocae]APT91810.1 DNA-binding protein [Corynebacterium phocae]KAA8727966.1 DNA-binding protein [Corynebacterium phocae]